MNCNPNNAAPIGDFRCFGNEFYNQLLGFKAHFAGDATLPENLDDEKAWDDFVRQRGDDPLAKTGKRLHKTAWNMVYAELCTRFDELGNRLHAMLAADRRKLKSVVNLTKLPGRVRRSDLLRHHVPVIHTLLDVGSEVEAGKIMLFWAAASYGTSHGAKDLYALTTDFSLCFQGWLSNLVVTSSTTCTVLPEVVLCIDKAIEQLLIKSSRGGAQTHAGEPRKKLVYKAFWDHHFPNQTRVILTPAKFVKIAETAGVAKSYVSTIFKAALGNGKAAAKYRRMCTEAVELHAAGEVLEAKELLQKFIEQLVGQEREVKGPENHHKNVPNIEDYTDNVATATTRRRVKPLSKDS